MGPPDDPGCTGNGNKSEGGHCREKSRPPRPGVRHRGRAGDDNGVDDQSRAILQAPRSESGARERHAYDTQKTAPMKCCRHALGRIE